MNILLDTHVLIWALYEPQRLSAEVCEELTNPQHGVFFSAANIWEISIKASLGRKDFSFSPEEVWHLAMETGFTELPVTSAHGAGVLSLPWHHRDPFDRLLISQAFSLPAYFYTVDEALPIYSSSLVRLI
jgi:PIN domain nuclease of toxin-antitoxin system